MSINLTLIGQMGTFLVFWWFIYNYVYPLFSKMAEERRQKIADGLSMADEAKKSMQVAEEESGELLRKAKQQANDIISQAHKQADQIVAESRADAQNVGKQELTRAREEIAQEKQRASRELRSQLAILVIEGAEQVIGREVKADDHARLLQELSEKL